MGRIGYRYFLGAMYHKWLDVYTGTTDTPQTYSYLFGNPLVAQTMLRHDLAVALHISGKIVIVEKADGTWTRVAYDGPASIIAIPRANGESVNPELANASEVLS